MTSTRSRMHVACVCFSRLSAVSLYVCASGHSHYYTYHEHTKKTRLSLGRQICRNPTHNSFVKVSMQHTIRCREMGLDLYGTKNTIENRI